MKKSSITIQWILTALFGICVIGNGFHWSSLFLLLATILIIPIPVVRKLFKSLKIKNWLIIALSILIFLIGENTDLRYSRSGGEHWKTWWIIPLPRKGRTRLFLRCRGDTRNHREDLRTWFRARCRPRDRRDPHHRCIRRHHIQILPLNFLHKWNIGNYLIQW